MYYFKNKFTANRLFSTVKMGMLFLLFLTSSIVYGQAKTIPVVKGVVKNDAGELLIGASISVRGTKTFTTSKGDGSFVLTNVPEGAVLNISYVGHTRTEIKLKPGQTEVSVRMVPSSSTLNEVVVNTGLYKRPTGNFTGAAKSFSGEELKIGKSFQCITGPGNIGTICED